MTGETFQIVFKGKSTGANLMVLLHYGLTEKLENLLQQFSGEGDQFTHASDE